MGFVLGWLMLSIISGVFASNKGRSAAGFFLLSIVLSPLVGILAALAAKPNHSKLDARKIKSGECKRCPFCREVIKVKAIVCKHCGKDINENYHSGNGDNKPIAVEYVEGQPEKIRFIKPMEDHSETKQ